VLLEFLMTQTNRKHSNKKKKIIWVAMGYIGFGKNISLLLFFSI